MAQRPNFQLIGRANGTAIRFYVENNGRKERIYLYEAGWTAEEAVAAMVEYKQKSGFVEDKDITIAGFLNKFYSDYVEQSVEESTARRYDEFTAIHIVPNIGNIQLQKLKPAELQSLYTKLSKGLSTTTVLKVHRFLHLAFKYAILWGYLRFNPADGVKPPAQAKTEMIIPTDDEMKAILKEAENDMSAYMPIYIASTTGMRLGEILALQISNVDFDAKKYFIQSTLKRQRKNGERSKTRTETSLTKKHTKTQGSRRPIPFLPGTEAVLKKYVKQKKERQLKAKKYNQSSEFFIVNKFGNPLAVENTSKRFKAIIKKLGLSDKIRFHDLRHYHASWLLRQGVHPKVAQERLGHSSIKITLDTYSHLIPDMQASIVSNLDSSIFSAGHDLGTKTAVGSGTQARRPTVKRHLKLGTNPH